MTKSGYSFILLSGGTGTRMNNNVPKQYMMLCGKPLIMHTLERIDDLEEIDEVIIVCQSDYEEIIGEHIANYHLNKIYKFAPAGKSRQESVYNGLKLAERDQVIIHEAARPFVKKNEFLELMRTKEKNVTYGSPINYTVLTYEDGVIDGILQRDRLVNIQLPQKFETMALLASHEKAIADEKLFTEDASLLYYYTKETISVLRGKDYNLKVTTPEDMIIGERLYKEFFVGR